MKELLGENGRLTEASPQRPVCCWALDRSYVFQTISGDSVKLFGKPPEALAGRRIMEALSGQLVSAWKSRFDRVLEGEPLLIPVVPEAAGDGQTERFYSVLMFPIRVNGGSVILAAGCARDITAWLMTEQQLRAAALEMLHLREDERARVSRLLHDTLGQSLSAAGLQLDVLRMDLENRVPEIGERTAEIQRMVEEVVNQIRDLTYQLDPAIAERVGLRPALDRLVGFHRRSFTGTIRLIADASVHLPREAAAAMYKIAQEAIEISVRSAKSTTIELLLKSTENGETLEIGDDGDAFDGSGPDTRRALGFMLMQHCAAEAGLDLVVSRAPGNGTVVRATHISSRADGRSAMRS